MTIAATANGPLEVKPNEDAAAPVAAERNGVRLVQSYEAWLKSVIARRFGPNRVDDVFQECCLRLASRANANIRNPKAFLLCIASNVVRDADRRKVAQASREFQWLSWGERQGCDDQHLIMLLKQTIATLPPKLRDVLILNHVYGFTHREIAERFGISVKAVEKRMQRAMALCAEKLKD